MALLALASSAIRTRPAAARCFIAHRRPVRRGAVLRRGGADARDLGGVGGRGSRSRHQRLRAAGCCRSLQWCWWRCSCFSARAPRSSGALFGPVCLLWFIALGAVGIWQIAQTPVVLEAVDPRHALRFLTGHGFASFMVMGAVLLAFTGAEALYADMGHFGKWPIRARVVRAGAASAGAQLLRPGRAADRQPEGAGKPVLPRISRLGALSDGGARHRRDDHRVAGDRSPAPIRSRARRSSSASCRA